MLFRKQHSEAFMAEGSVTYKFVFTIFVVEEEREHVLFLRFVKVIPFDVNFPVAVVVRGSVGIRLGGTNGSMAIFKGRF